VSPRRRALSALLVVHVSALFTAALPAGPVMWPPSLDAPERVKGPALAISTLDTAAVGVFSTVSKFTAHTGVLRTAASRYLSALGLVDRWEMFSNLSRADDYVRLRYYITGPTGRRMATQLIVPAHPAGHVRTVRGFWDFPRDRAVLSYFEFNRSEHGTERLRERLLPAVIFYTARFAAGRLSGDERIVRTELWYGSADNPLTWKDTAALEREHRRTEALDDYRGGPIEQVLVPHVLPRLLSVQFDHGISWILEVAHEPE
jgi:hypothetical protein